MIGIPATLQTLSTEKQKFFLFLTRHCGFTFRMRIKRGTHWVLRFTYPDTFDTNIIYEVRQDDFSPAKQWLRIARISEEMATPLYDAFIEMYNDTIDAYNGEASCSPHS